MRKGNVTTSKLSRDHHIISSATGLITVIGGKWTTYRKMGEDAVNAAIASARLPNRPSETLHLKLHGWRQLPEEINASNDEDPELDSKIHPALPYSVRQIIRAVRREYARTTEDVLARRTRALFLNAQAAIDCAPNVCAMVARELGRNETARAADLTNFLAVAREYKFTR
jgi:glycerol-3-phosphate dehydrogenase